jgi:hypothetical protein
LKMSLPVACIKLYTVIVAFVICYLAFLEIF